jgi:hypothetical protein
MLTSEARDLALRLDMETTEREHLAHTNVTRCDLPYLSEGIDLGGLFTLAARIRECP